MKSNLSASVSTIAGGLKSRRLAVGLAVAGLAILIASLALLSRGSGPGGGIEAPGFALSPGGAGVGRLTPVKVTFKRAPAQRDGKALLTLDPPAEGDYIWQSERTLIFQPAFPGLLRGFDYTVQVAAQPDAGLSRAVEQKFTTADALTVETVIPAADDVEVPGNGQVLVQFSRSVAPLTELSSQPEGKVLGFQPSLAGHGEWLNTSLYRFVPDAGALAPNTKYRVTVPAGLSSAADGVLKQDYVWSFTSFGPAIDAVKPDVNTKFVGPAQQVVVKFNQPMDRASVEDAFKLTEGGAPVAGSFAWADADTSTAFTPDAPLAPLKAFQVSVGQAGRGAHGGQLQVAWQSSFTTVGLPVVTSTSPVDGTTGAPRYGVSFKFSNPMDEDSLEGKVSIAGIDPTKINQFLTPDGLNLSLGVTLSTSTGYRVTLAAGALDRYGQPMGAYSFSFTTGARPPSVTLAIPGDITTYSASAEPLLYYHATNSSEAHFALYPITKDELHKLQLQGYISRDPRDTFKPSLPALYSWTEDVTGALDEVLLKSTSLSRGQGPLPRGDYYVEAGSQYRTSMVFSVVDTAIVTKVSYDGLVVWALDLDSGRPVSGAALSLSGGPVDGPATATTDADGLARFNLPSLIGRQPTNDRRYLVDLEDGGRYGTSSTLWGQGSDLYTLGIPQEYYPKTYVGQIYTDRPIYRPGEEVQYKGIIRLDDDADYSVPDKLESVYLDITAAGGKQLRHGAVALNDAGSFTGSIVLGDDVPTGDYSLTISWQPSPTYQTTVAYELFTVAEFRKPEFEVKVNTPETSYVAGDAIDAAVQASYFFGGPVEGAPVDWSASSLPFIPRFAGYERYSFTDQDSARTQVVRAPARASGSGATSSSGGLGFSLAAVITGNEGPQTYTLSASVHDISAQTVAGSATVTVHPAAVYAGIKPVQYLATAGKQAGADLVTVDTDGKLVAGRTVTVTVSNRVWVTTKQQTPDGARRYLSEPRDTLIATVSAVTDKDGRASVNFTPPSAGTLRLVAAVTDARGRVNKSATYLWVTGGGYASWEISNSDALKLIADRDQYKVGDVAHILVPAPFAGATGLVTVERGKVRESSVRAFPGNSEVLEVPITDGGVPDVFVGVVLYRPPTADDPVPRYKVGYVELKVSTDTRVLNVSIKPDRDQARPGDVVHYDIQVTDSQGKGTRSEVSVSVVDKAILSLADERGPDGLHAFWFERGLGVNTASSLAVSVNRANDVISEAAVGGKGGGGLSDERIRQDFRNSAFWQAQLVTDDAGHASVDVTMPDNLTTWRMQVRAISGDILVGEGTSELLSTQPLLLRPTLPRFLRVGDRPSVRLVVTNSTRSATSVTVGLRAEGIEITDAADRTVEVAAGGSTLVQWPASVSAEGMAKLTFSASSNVGLSDAISQELPVYLDVTPETTATGGVVKGKEVDEAVYLPPYALLDKGSLTISVQAALTKQLAPELSAFAPRPYEGAADKATRIAATLAVMRSDKTATVPFTNSQLSSDVAALIALQKGDGGWAWCSLCPTSDPEITAWVLIALGQWRHEGNSINQQSLEQAAGYVQSYINRLTDVEHPADVNQKAYLLYALSIAGKANANLPTMRALFQQSRAKLTNWGRAYLLLGFSEAGLTRKDKEVSALLNDLAGNVLSSATGNHWEDPHLPASTQTSPRTTAVVLEALVRAAPDHPLIEETVRWLNVALRGGSGSSIQQAEAILALSNYAAMTGEIGADYAYSVGLDGSPVLAGRLKSADPAPSEKKLTLPAVGTGTSILSLARDFSAKGRLYYTLDLRYATPAAQIDALNRGLAVSHEYTLLDAPGTSVSQARLGEVVRVTVTVVAPADRNYVVVEDGLPAGLEAIDPKLKTTDPALRSRLDSDKLAAANAGRPAYSAPWLRWYYSPWQQVDLRDNRVVLSAQRLSKGVYEYVYYARATTPGDFYTAPAHAEESYFPEVFGRGDSGRFVIAP